MPMRERRVSEPGVPPAAEVARLGLSPFYAKYVSAGGLPVVSSAKVMDAALQEAGFLILGMLEARPDVLDALIASRLRVAVIARDELLGDVPENAWLDRAYWDGRARGLGAGRKQLAVTAAEENLLALEGDPYLGESVLIHEFAHAIAEKGLYTIEPEFEAELKAAFEQACSARLWASTYASTRHEEYWAELLQSWFHANHASNPHHNHVDTRAELFEYDPVGARLVERALGKGQFFYVDPSQRAELPHLRELDRAALPAFAWPADVVRLTQPVPGDAGRGLRSAREGREDATLYFDNQREQRVRLFWVDFDGQLRDGVWLWPHADVAKRTKVGHCFLVTDEQQAPLAGFCAEPGKTRAIIASYW